METTGRGIRLRLPRSTRGILLFLVLVALVPMLLVQATIYYSRFQERRTQELQSNLEMARAVAVAFYAYVADVLRQEYAIGLALTYPQSMSPDHARVFLTRDAAQYASVRSFSWGTPDGRLVASSLPEAIGVDVRDRPYFQEILQGKEWAVSDLLASRATSDPIFTIARGIRDQSGVLQGVVVAGVNPRVLDVQALPVRRTGGGAISLIDRQGIVVYRYPKVEEEWVQRNILDKLPEIAMVLKGEELAVTFDSEIDGERRMGGMVPVSSIGWAAMASRPESEVLASLIQDLLRDIGLVFLVAIGSFLIALSIGRKIIVPVSRLKVHANALGAGDLSQRVVVSGAKELEDLANTFNKMAGEIQSQQEELQSQNEELQSQQEELQSQNEELQSQQEELQSQNEELQAQSEEIMAHEEQLKQVNRELEVERARWQVTVESMLDLVVVADNDGNIIYLNPARAQLIAHGLEPASALYGGLATDGALSGLEEPPLRRAALRGEIVTDAQIVLRTPRGEETITVWNAAPLHDDEGRVVGAVAVGRDVTQQRKAEEERERLLGEVGQRATELDAANKELEAFSYSVSHDLRAPLRAIDGFSMAILEDYGDKLDDRGREYLQFVRQGSQRMAQLIDDMLALSRVTRREMRRESVDLSSSAKAVIEELQKLEAQRQAEITVAPGLVVHGDTQLLRQALENLLGNAWKFTSTRPVARIELGVTEHDGEAVYYVRDNGVGFDSAYAGKLFGAFQRLHSESEFPGTGIGLATVYRIISRHGGRIWAEGVVDQGATFYFTL